MTRDQKMGQSEVRDFDSFLNCRTADSDSAHKVSESIVLLFYFTMIVIARSLRRRRADILYVGESSLDVGEQTVGETTRRRNDRLPPLRVDGDGGKCIQYNSYRTNHI